MSRDHSLPAVWKGDRLVQSYLRDIRSGIPYGVDQIAIALRVASSLQPAVTRMLDLGCGDGIVGSSARRYWPDAELTLLDFSRPMLDAALQRFAGEERVAVVEADFGSPGWMDSIADRQPFDLILSAYAIHHQEDTRKQVLYREIACLLAPGGVFVNIEHVQSSSVELEAIWNQLLIDTLIAHHPDRDPVEVERAFAMRPDRFANRLTPVETQLEWLRQAGLSDVDCYFKVLELAVIGGRLHLPPDHHDNRADQAKNEPEPSRTDIV